MEYKKTPAIIKYIGEPMAYKKVNYGKEEPFFTVGNLYEAYFLEYFEGMRDAVHVKCNDGYIRYLYISINDFEIVSDEDNLLNYDEAIVKCISHEYDEDFLYITYGKEYKAIGKDRDGDYLVMDDSCSCYFYSVDYFEIVSDPNGVLAGSKDCYWFNDDETIDDSIEEEPEDADKDYYVAHKYSSNHRAELEKDKICGCFDCLHIFSPSEIKEWFPESPDGECVTAVCPYCGDDTIIGESSGYPITKVFLKKMQDYWCK